MTKDLYDGNIDKIILGAYDLIKYKEVFIKMEDQITQKKYFGFENLKT